MKTPEKKVAVAVAVVPAPEGTYPAWRYHKEQPPVLVENEAADKALGKGWADSPAAFVKE